MGWFRKKRKEIAQEFVEDVKQEITQKTKKKSKDWLHLALLATPVAIEIVNLAIGTEKVSSILSRSIVVNIVYTLSNTHPPSPRKRCSTVRRRPPPSRSEP